MRNKITVNTQRQAAPFFQKSSQEIRGGLSAGTGTHYNNLIPNGTLWRTSQWALCMILSHGTKSAMLDGKRMQQPPKQSHFNQPSVTFLCFGCPSAWLACHPAGQILYHVTVSCKAPIKL